MKILQPLLQSEKRLAPVQLQLDNGDEYSNCLIKNQTFVDTIAKTVSLDMAVVEQVRFIGCAFARFRAFNTRFKECDMSNSDWEGSGLQRVEFIECKLTGLKLTDATVKDASFIRCRGNFGLFRALKTQRIAFDQCDLKGCDFEGSYLEGAVFTNCDLSDCEFSGAYLKGVDLRGSTITGIHIGIHELQEVTVDPGQAIYLAQVLGMKVG